MDERVHVRECVSVRSPGLISHLGGLGCMVLIVPYNTPMGHTQPAQNNNNRPYTLSAQKQSDFPIVPIMAMAMAMACVVNAPYTAAVSASAHKPAMQEPGLPPDI